MKLLALLVAAMLLPGYASAAEKPNVLIILADDCTFSDLPLYGGQNAKTPSIDRLATQRLTFNRAYVSAAMCQPCRAELFTGQFPMRKQHTFDGTSFAAVLRGEKETHRQFAFAAHNNIPEGPAYPVRSVTGGQWRYIRNLTP